MNPLQRRQHMISPFVKETVFLFVDRPTKKLRVDQVAASLHNIIDLCFRLLRHFTGPFLYFTGEFPYVTAAPFERLLEYLRRILNHFSCPLLDIFSIIGQLASGSCPRLRGIEQTGNSTDQQACQQ